MRTFKIHLISGEVVTIQGDRLWTSRSRDDENVTQLLEVIIDLPMKEYIGTEHANRTSSNVVAVFPLSKIKAAFDGDLTQLSA